MISFLGRLFKKEPTPSQTIEQKATSPRIAEVNTENYSQSLLRTALSSGSAKERTLALKRIGQLLDEKSLAISQLTTDTQNNDELLIACSYANSAKEVLDTIIDETKLLELAIQAPTAPLRKAAAQRIQTRDAVEQLLRQAKGKDKNVYKIAKNTLDTFKAEDAELAQKHLYLESLCIDAERLAKKGFDHLFTHKFTSLEEDWQKAKGDTTEALSLRFEQGIAKCQAIIDAEIAKSKAAALAEQQAKAAVSGITQSTQAVLEQLQALLKEPEVTDDILENATLRIEQEHSAVKAFIQNNSSQDDALIQSQKHAEREFIRTKESALILVNSLAQHGSLSSALQSLKNNDAPHVKALDQIIACAKKVPHLHSSEISAAQQALDTWRNEQHAQEQANKSLMREISELIRKANIAANSGQVRRARGIYKELCEKQNALEFKPSHLASKLETLEETMNKLGDWHDFAVTPKKEALIEKMDSLHQSSLAPDDLADKIHELQDEWKLLCKGGQNQDEALWQAFQQSADVAFAPCKEHFHAQAEIRESNAAERRKLISDLNNYHEAYNWEQANWKDVEHTLRVAKEAWKTLWPVPRNEQKALQAQFDATLDKIYAPMNESYERVKQKKELLISQAEKAANQTDPKLAAEEIKSLQEQWKQAGRTFRKADQQLWQKFRAACDSVFEKRQALFDESNALKQQKLEQGDALIRQIKAILENGGDTLQSSGQDVEQLKTDFYAIEELPKHQLSQFENTLKAIDKKISQFRQSREINNYRLLLTLHSEANEVCVNQLDPSAFQESVQQAQLPNPFKDELLSLTKFENVVPTNEAEEALRILCIRAEIAAGINSPEADKALRMKYQVEALQENFGSAIDDTPASLCKAWIQISGVPTKQLATLKDRFESALFDSGQRKEQSAIAETA